MFHSTVRCGLLFVAGLCLGCSAEHRPARADGTGSQREIGPASAGARSSATDAAETARAGSPDEHRANADSGTTSVRDDVLAVDLVPLRCSDACLEVSAVAKGGNPPYHYLWQDGSTDTTRSVCPANDPKQATPIWSVVVTDTALTNSEFAHAMLTTRASLTPEQLACEQNTPCNAGAVAAIPSGHYEGSIGGCTAGEQIELPDENQVPSLAQITLDLMIDPTRTEQSGQLRAAWVVGGLITFKAPIMAVLDCNTAVLHGTWSGQWGYGFGDPSAQIDGGPAWGDLTLAPVANMPDRYTGSFNSYSALPANGTAVDLSTIPGIPAFAGAPALPVPDAGQSALSMGGRCTHGTIRIERKP